MSTKSSTKKLLLSINQSNPDNLIYFYFKLFDRAEEANTYTTKSRILPLQLLSLLYFSSFIFNENEVINKEKDLSQKAVIVEEDLEDIDIDDIGNLEDLPRLVFINEDCENPKVVN